MEVTYVLETVTIDGSLHAEEYSLEKRYDAERAYARALLAAFMSPDVVRVFMTRYNRLNKGPWYKDQIEYIEFHTRDTSLFPLHFPKW